MKRQLLGSIALAGALVFSTTNAHARNFLVTIKNITPNQIFTPILVVAHRPSLKLITLGEPARDGIAEVAEGGDTGPLADALAATGQVGDMQSVGGLLGPGESATVEIAASWRRNRAISLVGMLLPTNDGMVVLNGAQVPRYGKRVLAVRAYDAGTEFNDQLCANIPGGGACGGEGFNPEDGEGFVHPHPGIHETGDLTGAEYDWTDPVAIVTIERAY
ncbi:MAG: spondin domain-containing protein [Pseudomonadota bacterium]